MPALKYKDLPHYVYDDYVKWEGRWELIHGIPYAMAPAPSFFHQLLNTKIVTELTNLLENCILCKACIFLDYKLAEDTVLQPDAVVLCEPFDKGGFYYQTT